MTDCKLVPVEPTPEMVSAAEDAYMPFGDMDLALRMAILAAPDVQGELVGWQFYKHGKWWNGDNLTQDQRENFKKKGVRVRNVYAEPQLAEWTPAPDVAELVEALEACDTALFCDLKTDEEKSTFFLSGRGYETGVIAQAIQNDVAMAYHRCSEYRKEMEALQAENALLRAAIRHLCNIYVVDDYYEGQLREESLDAAVNRAINATPQPSEQQPDVAQLVEALEEGLRAIGDHHAPGDCYATGPMTGDPFRDLVQCPACSFIAMCDDLLAAHRKQGGSND